MDNLRKSKEIISKTIRLCDFDPQPVLDSQDDEYEFVLQNERNKKMYVRWLFRGKLDVRINSLVSKIQDDHITFAIVVANDGATPKSRKIIRLLRMIGIHVTVFKFNESLVDVLSHDLVPPHRILTRAEAEKLKKTYNITPKNLSQISLQDAVCKRIGARVGDIIEIERKNLVWEGKTQLAYRKVVNAPT